MTYLALEVTIMELVLHLNGAQRLENNIIFLLVVMIQVWELLKFHFLRHFHPVQVLLLSLIFCLYFFIDLLSIVILNNDCNRRTLLPILPTSVFATTQGAITYQEEVPTSCSISKVGIVWYSVMGDGQILELSLCNTETQFNTYLSIYSGSCDELVCLIKNDDFCGTRSKISICTKVGTEYFIAVGGSNSETGKFELDISKIGPCFDTTVCNGAIPVASDSITFGNTELLNAANPLSLICADHFNNVNIEWYSFIGTGKTVSIYTFGSCYDTALVLYSSYENGNCNLLECLASNDDSTASGHFFYSPSCYSYDYFEELTSFVQLCTQIGRTYYVLVTGYSSSSGPFTLTIDSDGDPCLPNGDFSTASLVTLNSPVDFSDVTQGNSGLDPFYCGVPQGTRGIWYTLLGTGDKFEFYSCVSGVDFTASIFMSSSTTQINMDTCVSGYQGLQGCNSLFTWCTKPGHVYWILVSSSDLVNLPPGSAIFTIQSQGFCSVTTTNDICKDNTLILPGIVGTITITGHLYYNNGDIQSFFDISNHLEFHPPQYAWYRVKGTGSLIFASLCESQFQGKIAVFESSCDYFPLVASSADGCFPNPNAKVQWCGIHHIDYLILVAPVDPLNSDLTFALKVSMSSTCLTTPCDPGAVTLLTLPVNQKVDTNQIVTLVNFNILNAPDDCGMSLSDSNAIIWYSFQTNSPSFLVIAACNTTLDVRLGVYESYQCLGTFTCAPSNSYSDYIISPGDCPSAINLCTDANQVYYLAVGTKNDQRGIFTLSIESLGICSFRNQFAPRCDYATPVPSLPYFVLETTSSTATYTNCDGTLPSYKYLEWYSIVGNGNSIIVDACGNDQDIFVTIFTGNCAANPHNLTCFSSTPENSCFTTFCAYPDEIFYIVLGSKETNVNVNFLLAVVEGSVCIGVPSAPEIFTLYVIDNGISLYWSSEPLFGFPILNYNYSLTSDQSIPVTDSNFDGNFNLFFGLEPGTTYTFSISAKNRWGESSVSTAEITTFSGNCFLPFTEFVNLVDLSRASKSLNGNLFSNVPANFDINAITLEIEINQSSDVYLLLYESSNDEGLPSLFTLVDFSYTYISYTGSGFYNYYPPPTYYGYYYYDDYYYEDDYYDYYDSYYGVGEGEDQIANYEEFKVEFDNLNWHLCQGKSYLIALSSPNNVKYFQIANQNSIIPSCLGNYIGISIPTVPDTSSYVDIPTQIWETDQLYTSPYLMNIDADLQVIPPPLSFPAILEQYSTIDSIFVSWEYPCVEPILKYEVSINFGTPVDVLLPDHSYTFTDLQPDTLYTITIKVISAASSRTTQIQTTTLNVDYKVQWGFSVNKLETSDKSVSFISDLAVDNSGNTVVLGSFSNIIAFTTGTSHVFQTRPYSGNCFIVSYDDNSHLQWAISIGSNYENMTYCTSIDTDSDGNIVIGGSFQNIIYFTSTDSISTENNYQEVLFIAKYDKNGNFLFAKHAYEVSGYYDTKITSLEIDSQDNIIATGFMQGEDVYFVEDSVDVFIDYFSSNFITKWSSSGAYQFTNSFQATSFDTDLDDSYVSIDKNDDSIYVAGSFYGVIEIENQYLGMEDWRVPNSYVSKFSSNGNLQWLYGIVYTYLTSTVVSNNAVYISGYFFDDFDLYFTPSVSDIDDVGSDLVLIHSAESSQNVFSPYIISLEKDGNYNWISTFVEEVEFSSSIVYISSLAVLPSDDIVAVGTYLGQFNTDNTNVKSLPFCAYYSSFVFHYSQYNYLVWSTAMGSWIDEQLGVAIDTYNDRVVVGGDYIGSLTIDCTTSLSTGVSNSYLVNLKGFTTSQPTLITPPTPCNFTFTNYTGSVRFPAKSNETYANGLDCYFLFRPNDVYHVALTFSLLSLSGTGDYIVAYDGDSVQSQPLRYFDGENSFVTTDLAVFYDNYNSESNLVVRSQNSSLLLHFHTDSCYTCRGFELLYESAPKEALCDNRFPRYFTDETGTISEGVSGGYRNNADCLYFIVPSFEVNFIIIDFIKFKVEKEDYLIIYDGNNPKDATVLGIFYGGSSTYTVQSTERSVVLKFVTSDKYYNNGWTIKYRGVTDKVYCDGTEVLEGNSGTFTSQTRSKYLPSANCTWEIHSKAGAKRLVSPLTYLFFPDFELSYPSTLTVFYSQLGIPLAEPIISSDQLIISDGNITAQFYANMATGKGFNGTYCVQTESSCPNEFLDDSTGTFNNHFCGLYYQGDADCFWRINPSNSDGKYVMITFSLIDFNNNALDGITDSLSIYECPLDNCRQILQLYESKEYYENNEFPVVVSTDPLKFEFISDTFNSGEGFDATYCVAFNSPCNRALNQPSGYFTNQFCQGYYEANATCTWTSTFSKPVGQTYLIIHDLKFANETFNGKWNDNLYIETLAGDLLYTFNSGGSFEGTKISPSQQNTGGDQITNPVVLSFNTEVEIEFESDDIGFEKGFNATYCIFTDTDARLCSGTTTFTQDTWIFGNQACNSYYQANADCIYSIKPSNFVASVKEILLYFLSLSFKNQNINVPTDYIKVYNGDVFQDQFLIGNYSKLVYDTPFFLSGNQDTISIKFKSDDVGFAQGFKAQYCLVDSPATSCGGNKVLSSFSGTLKDHVCGPTYIKPLDCFWTISPPLYNYTYIVLVFTSLDIGYNSDAIITVFDSNQIQIISSYPNYPVLSSNFGDSIIEGLAVFCNSASATIEFTVVDTASRLYSGFQVDYYTVTDNGICKANNQFTDPTGTIKDHTYGSYYQNRVTCAFLISLGDGKRIAIKFDAFDLEEGYDFLEVYDGSYWTADLIGLYTGNIIPDPFVSTSNSLYMVFTTDYSVIKKGFSLYYSDNDLLDCPLYCSNKGNCVNGTCECENNRYGLGCEIPPPPYLVEARYSISLGLVNVYFSRATNRGDMYSSVRAIPSNCSIIFSDFTVSKFGYKPTCYWADDQILVVKLGYLSKLLPDDKIEIRGGLISDPNPTPYTPIAGEMKTFVLPPTNLVAPQSTIVGPTTFRPDFPIQVNAFASYLDGGRPLSYAWTIIACDPCHVPVPYENCGCYDPDSALVNYVSSVNTSRLEIPTSYVSSYSMQTSFKIYVNATNFLGITGRSQPFEVSPTDPEFPSVSIKGPTNRDVNRGEVLLIQAQVDLPPTVNMNLKRNFDINCPDVQFIWEFDECDPAPCPLEIGNLLTSKSSQLYLDTSPLAFNGRYTVSVSVIINNTPSLKSNATVHINVSPVDVLVRIQGGNQVVSREKALNLTTTVIYPLPGQLPCMPKFSWSCRKSYGNPCVLEDNTYLHIDDQPNVSLNITGLLPGTYIFTSRADCDIYSGKDEISVQVLRRNQTILRAVNAKYRNPKTNSDDALVLLAYYAEDESVVLENIQWSVVSGNLELNSTTMLTETTNEFQLVIAPDVLEGGAVVVFKVEANAPGLEKGSVELVITINELPSPGYVFINPNIGYSTETEFTFFANGATDTREDLPLSYIFGVQQVGCDESVRVWGYGCPDIPLSNTLSFPSFTAYIPPGNYYPFVDVIDRAGATTRLQGPELIQVIDSCPSSSTQLAGKLLDIQNQMIYNACAGDLDKVRQLFNLGTTLVSCVNFTLPQVPSDIYVVLQDILTQVTESVQITKSFLDSQIKSLAIVSTAISSHSGEDDSKKLDFLDTIKAAVGNGESLGLLRKDSAGSLLNALGNVLDAKLPKDGVESFTNSLQTVGNSATLQYTCNNVPYYLTNSKIQIIIKKIFAH